MTDPTTPPEPQIPGPEFAAAPAQTPAEVEKLVSDALESGSGVLALTDEKGRRYLVQAARINYVEIGAADARRVGFGVGLDAAKPAG